VHPLPFAWPAGLAFWIASWWAFSAERRFMRRDRVAVDATADRGSMRVVLITSAASVFFAFLSAGALPAFGIPSGRIALYIAGILCLVSGGWLRRHCFRMLGDSFTYDVRAAPDQRVVERGAYRYVRHPSYSAGMLLFGGIGLALGNWLSLAITLVFPLLAYAYRISVEEHALVATLGPEYAGYMKRTSRLIPFLL
jgi:protein-S-isoprenylcysteine O-methyltransferase Ste14